MCRCVRHRLRVFLRLSIVYSEEVVHGKARSDAAAANGESSLLTTIEYFFLSPESNQYNVLFSFSK
ncbi:hypothetical protein C1N58_20530 [Pantoea sp. SGAir0180]